MKKYTITLKVTDADVKAIKHAFPSKNTHAQIRKILESRCVMHLGGLLHTWERDLQATIKKNKIAAKPAKKKAKKKTRKK